MLTVSTTHPRITYQVEQVQSYASIFFRCKTYFKLVVSLVCKGCNTLSNAWIKGRWTWRRLWVGPCTRPKKLSTKITTYLVVFSLLRLR